MTGVAQLLTTIRQTQDCSVRAAASLPAAMSGHVLPDDLVEFYKLCGGVSLFSTSAYSIDILPPNRVALANPVILVGASEYQLQQSRRDISWSWYVVAEGENRQYVSIDLAPDRLGRCYDSFWDTHAMPGYSPIIAWSFTELLARLVENSGRHWYWLQPGFDPIVDAYE